MDLLLGLLGAQHSLAASGCDGASPTVFFDALEKRRRSEGYHPSTGPAPGASGVYWRSSQGGSEIFGVASKAMRGGRPYVELTVGTGAPGCGTSWQTYRYSVPAQGDEVNQELDLLAAPGARTVFRVGAPSGGEVRAYLSNQQAPQVRAWYRRTMSVSWKREKVLSSSLPVRLRDTMYFTRRNEYCFIWVSAQEASAKTIVLVSTGTR